jgi:hypothetical protein
MARRNLSGHDGLGLSRSDHGEETYRRCVEFPIQQLDFISEVGIYRPMFATMRLGLSWSRRLQQGDKVLIGFVKTIVGIRIVEAVDTGNIIDMLNTHAIYSHMELDGDGDRLLAARRRYESLVGLYGPHIVNEKKKLTVIYLRRF